MSKITQMPARAYKAKLSEVPWENTSFKVAGTLDGFIDLATPCGTFPLSLEEAANLADAIISTIADVKSNRNYHLHKPREVAGEGGKWRDGGAEK